MKKKIFIAFASVLVLAVIVTMSIYAQSGSKNSNGVTTEQTDKKVNEKCQGCPHHSSCAEATTQTTDTTSNCKAKCEKMKSCCDSLKCKEMKSGSEASKCCDKKETSACTRMTDCNKDCKKKSN